MNRVARSALVVVVISAVAAIGGAIPASAQSTAQADPTRDAGEDGTSVSHADIRRVEVDFGAKHTKLIARFESLAASAEVIFIVHSTKKSNSYLVTRQGADTNFFYPTKATEAYLAPQGKDDDLSRCIVSSTEKTGTRGYVKVVLRSSCVKGKIAVRGFARDRQDRADIVTDTKYLSRG